MAANTDGVPSGSDVLVALRAVHRQSPDLGRTELYAHVKADKQWLLLSNKHLLRAHKSICWGLTKLC